QRGHLDHVRHLKLGVNVAHEGDVEDVAQVPERLAGAYLAARVCGIDEGLGEEQHLKARRGIVGTHDPWPSQRVFSISREICKKKSMGMSFCFESNAFNQPFV